MRELYSVVLIVSLAAACGGSTQSAASPADEPIESGTNTPAVSAEATPEESSTEAPNSEGSPADTPASASPEPAFTENMSVSEAQKAVPPGADRANLDPETLGKPLQNLELYEPCKPAGAKVKIRVAVWDGKAVGVDVTTSPKNDALSGCIAAKIRELSWDKKVKSLNTIEYQF